MSVRKHTNSANPSHSADHTNHTYPFIPTRLEEEKRNTQAQKATQQGLEKASEHYTELLAEFNNDSDSAAAAAWDRSPTNCDEH
jgi:hypothetical protein